MLFSLLINTKLAETFIYLLENVYKIGGLTVSVSDHCISFYFELTVIKDTF